jgi:hypothetical protein
MIPIVALVMPLLAILMVVVGTLTLPCDAMPMMELLEGRCRWYDWT